MQKENPPTPKSELRKQFLLFRKAISQVRREEAATAILKLLATRGRILSFYSIGSEIDLSLLNTELAKLGRLAFNRLEEGVLVPYYVGQEQELIVSRLGIPEPDPNKNKRAPLSEIDLILVPGVVFDRENYRLGYGGGLYDRFLATTGNIPTLGVGFKEQLSPHLLPRDPWDIPVTKLILT